MKTTFPITVRVYRNWYAFYFADGEVLKVCEPDTLSWWAVVLLRIRLAWCVGYPHKRKLVRAKGVRRSMERDYVALTLLLTPVQCDDVRYLAARQTKQDARHFEVVGLSPLAVPELAE